MNINVQDNRTPFTILYASLLEHEYHHFELLRVYLLLPRFHVGFTVISRWTHLTQRHTSFSYIMNINASYL